LIKVLTLLSIVTLAITVLGRSVFDTRLPISVIVSLGGIVLAARALSTRKVLWAVAFLGVIGVFTPFRSTQFSQSWLAILDMAALALFAVSPILFRPSPIPVAALPYRGSIAAMTENPAVRTHRS
jgi:hypothetical protein